MLHHHINRLDIERLDDYSSIELEARLADIVHRITHLEHMLKEATATAAAISDQRPIRSIGAEAIALERFNDGL